MIEVEFWLCRIKVWYQTPQNTNWAELAQLIDEVPPCIWTEAITEESNSAIAYWMDACMRMYLGQKNVHSDTSYQYILMAMNILHGVVAQKECDPEIRAWSLVQIKRLTVLGLELCSEQRVPWHDRSNQLIEQHVNFMQFHDEEPSSSNAIRSH